MYVAPDAVNAYLCRQKRLHEVPVFRSENSHSDKLKKLFLQYYINKNKFSSRKSKYSQAVLRIRIHMFLGRPDPDPLGRGMDPDPDPALDPDPSIIMQK